MDTHSSGRPTLQPNLAAYHMHAAQQAAIGCTGQRSIEQKQALAYVGNVCERMSQSRLKAKMYEPVQVRIVDLRRREQIRCFFHCSPAYMCSGPCDLHGGQNWVSRLQRSRYSGGSSARDYGVTATSRACVTFSPAF